MSDPRRSPAERRLHVGASTTPGEVFLPRAAVEFSERRPDVELDVRIAHTEEIVAALKGREVELAVVGREVDDPDLQGRVLEQDELVLVVAASSEMTGSELHPDDLAGMPFVMREEGSATRRVAEEALAAAGQEARVAMELGSNAAVVAAVAEGEGLVGVVPAGEGPFAKEALRAAHRARAQALRWGGSLRGGPDGRGRALNPHAPRGISEARTGRRPARRGP
jgi:DNA-binding transcriptional LysR family regulator